MTIAKIVSIDTTNKIIYTDIHIPFNMSTTTFNSSTTIKKVGNNNVHKNFELYRDTYGIKTIITFMKYLKY